ncbi:MAG: dephospho-CoA kinase, partial [Verrucomicrobiaceae bacterium]
MHVMALTGGIASGKSTVCRFLREFLPSIVIYDCDAAVHRMLEGDAEVTVIIAETFGGQALDAQGRIDRHFLRGRVFADEAARLRLEAILHPRVKQECLASLQEAATRGAELFVADVPLFFEKGFDFGQDQVLVVASSRATQIQRLKGRGAFEDSLIESILAAQLPVQEKMSLADVVFWNEGPQSVIRSQVRRFAQAFLMSLSTESETAESQAATAAAPVSVPVSIDINQFRLKPLSELQAMAETLPARIQGGIPKSQLVYELMCFYSHEGVGMVCEGVIEQAKDN